LPEPVLNALRALLTPHLPVQLEAPGKVSLFVYDNHTFIVENFRDEPVHATALLALDQKQAEDIVTGEQLPLKVREQPAFWGRPAKATNQELSVEIPPHSFRAFRTQ
jgi:hypothetical protein